MAAGALALAGGNEFRPGYADADRLLASLAPGPVLIVPTAAAHSRPDLAAANGVRHFQGLGFAAEAAMVVDARSAADPTWLRAAERAGTIYLAGGDPGLLLEVLRDSPFWRACLAAHARGATLAGSSAGAMVLAGWLGDRRGGLVPALRLVPDVLILPHHRGGAAPRLPAGVTGLGIAEETTCLREGGEEWQVWGGGGAWLYPAEAAPRHYPAGGRFRLPAG